MTKDPFYRNHKIRDAINQAIYDAMTTDSSIHLFGEGAMIKVHYDVPQIERDFADRVHTLPISEDSNLNFAVGASLVGVKPIVNVITADFLYRAMDSICNTAAKLNHVRAEGSAPKTIVVQAEFLTGGPTTGQRPEALFTHIPGLNVVLPSTPENAYNLMSAALNESRVTVFFEDRMLRDDLLSPQPQGGSWERRIRIFGRPENKPDILIISYGLTSQIVEVSLEKAQISGVDFYDLQVLYPLDWPNLCAFAELAGNVLVVEPDSAYGGIGAEIAAHLAEMLPGLRVARLGAPHETIPVNRPEQTSWVPTGEVILRRVKELRDGR